MTFDKSTGIAERKIETRANQQNSYAVLKLQVRSMFKVAQISTSGNRPDFSLVLYSVMVNKLWSSANLMLLILYVD